VLGTKGGNARGGNQGGTISHLPRVKLGSLLTRVRVERLYLTVSLILRRNAVHGRGGGGGKLSV